MVIINQIGKLLVEAPTGVWEKIIMAFNSNIANYALAIICLTLVIKLILFPFDFLNRKFTRKSTKMQAEIQPEIDVLKKKYGNNQKELNAKTMEVYKKHNYNVGGTCLVTLITMVLTMVVFFTLFAGLNKMSSYKVAQQYEDLRLAYYGVEKVEDIASVDLSTLNEEEARARVLEEYKAKKESFLWIENVWMADSPFKNPVPTFSEYAKLVGLTKEQQTEEAKETIPFPMEAGSSRRIDCSHCLWRRYAGRRRHQAARNGRRGFRRLWRDRQRQRYGCGYPDSGNPADQG